MVEQGVKQAEKSKDRIFNINYSPIDPKDSYNPKEFMNHYESFEIIQGRDKKQIINLMYGSKDGSFIYGQLNGGEQDGLVGNFSAEASGRFLEFGRNQQKTLINLLDDQELFGLSVSSMVHGKGDKNYNKVVKTIKENSNQTKQIKEKPNEYIESQIKGYSDFELALYILPLKNLILETAAQKSHIGLISTIKEYGGVNKFAHDMIKNAGAKYDEVNSNLEKIANEQNSLIEGAKENSKEILDSYEKAKNEKLIELTNTGLTETADGVMIKKNINKEYQEHVQRANAEFNGEIKKIQESYKGLLEGMKKEQMAVGGAYESLIYGIQTFVYKKLKQDEERKKAEVKKKAEEEAKKSGGQGEPKS